MEMRHSKWTSYVLEIIVIITGILGAFWLDNWNQERIDRKTEMNVLNEIKDNIHEDMTDFNKNIANIKLVHASTKNLLDAVKKDRPYHQSYGFYLKMMMIYPHFTPNISGYELLKSKGLDLISDNKLRKSISNLYETQYEYLLTWEREIADYRIAHLDKEKIKYTSIIPVDSSFAPIELDEYWGKKIHFDHKTATQIRDFKSFKKDIGAHAVLYHVMTETGFLLPFHERTKAAALEVADEIEKYTVSQN